GAGMGSPMVTVVGRVAALRERLQWFERRPLHGRRIVVTRARAQSSGFLERLRAMGADAVELPVIAVEPAAEQRDLDAALDRLVSTAQSGRASWTVFTSANAVELVWDALQRGGRDARGFAGARVVAIGPETAAALLRHGLRAAHVWLPRAAAARDVLPDQLRDAGAEVEVLALYRTVLPPETARLLGALLD